MYKIMIYINTYSGDKWFYYQENEKDYVAHSLHEIKETVLTLIDTYGKDNIKIVKQVTGEDMEGSVETFIYDSTDNYEELVNRPSINGVEIIGALSLAELGIQPAGDYATNAKVDELEQAVNNIDLSPYATNERVDQVEAKVDNIDLTPYATNVRVDQVEHKVDNIDLTPYATNARVDQVEAKVDAIDLEPYATMDYLDEVVANIDFSSTNEEISGIKTFSVLPRSAVMPVTEDELTNKSYVDHEVLGCATEEYVDNAVLAAKKSQIYQLALTDKIPTSGRQLTSSELSELSKICNSILTLNDTQAQIQLYLKNDKYIGFLYPEIEYLPTEKTIYDVLKSTRTKYLQGKLGCATYPANTNYGFFDVTMIITGTYNSSTNQISITKAVIQSNVNNHVYNVMGISKSYLSKTNTTSFTPTSNYHPATKLYVDNAVAKIEIPEVNLDDYATKKYVDDAIASIDIPESGESGGVIDFGDTPVYVVSTKSGTNMTTEHVVLDDYNAPDYGTALRKAISSGAKTFIISLFFTGHGMSLDLRYTINDDGSIFVLKLREPFKVSVGSYIIGYSPVIENMVTNISSIETATMYLRVQHMNQSALCPIEKNTATKSYVDNAIANAITAVLGGEY